MENVKRHFESEGEAFDSLVKLLCPGYEGMLKAMVSSIALDPEKPLEAIDLGCGTGASAKLLKEAYPNASISCVDIAEKMLSISSARLGSGPEMRYQLGNFENYEFDRCYDVAIASLSLHHLVSASDKRAFYGKIFSALKPGGVFSCADIVLASNDALQRVRMSEWREFMARGVSEEEIDRKWLPIYYDEDHPEKLTDHLVWLREAGFVDIDVAWKQCNFAVFSGRKP